MNPRSQDPVAAEEVRQRAKEIVAGLSPGEHELGWFQRLLDRLHFGSRVGSWMSEHSVLLEYTLYSLAALVVIALMFLLLHHVDWRHAHKVGAVDAGGESEVRERVEALLARARRARAAGDRLMALRLFFFAFIVGLSRRGDLEFREAWTNHELVDRGAHSAQLRETLLPLVLELDELVYGGRAITDTHLNRLEGLVEGIGA